MPRHTPLERAKNVGGANPARPIAPVLPPQASAQAVDVQSTLGIGALPPLTGRSLFGSGKFTKSELKRGFRVLDRPKLGRGQKPVSNPGVPTKK